MYFVIAPFVLIGLAAKLINNKIHKQKQSNELSLFNNIISNYTQITEEQADTSDTDRKRIRKFNRKTTGIN